MPEPDQRRNVNRAEGKEEDFSKRGGASVNAQPLAHQAQINPLVGHQPALGELHAGNFHAGNFMSSQLLLNLRIKFLRGETDPDRMSHLVIEDFTLLVFESEDEV